MKTQAEAQKIYEAVTKRGATDADFQALAKKDSIDTQSAKNGGALGTTPASKLVAPFAEAAMALKPGQISKPVHTQFGWHVIKLINKQVTPFAQAKSQLVQSQGPSVFNAWLKQQATDQTVNVNPKFGRYEVSSLSVVPITSTTRATRRHRRPRARPRPRRERDVRSSGRPPAPTSPVGRCRPRSRASGCSIS